MRGIRRERKKRGESGPGGTYRPYNDAANRFRNDRCSCGLERQANSQLQGAGRYPSGSSSVAEGANVQRLSHYPMREVRENGWWCKRSSLMCDCWAKMSGCWGKRGVCQLST